MYRSLQHEGSAENVDVVDAPAITSGPVPSELWLAAAAALAGALIGLLVACAVEFGRRGRSPEHPEPAIPYAS